MSLNSVISELRRRRVFRGAGLYLVGAWIALQLGDVLADPLALPVWSLTALLYLLILGFPIALFLSWRYQFTDAGLVRSSSDTAREAGHDPNLTSLDYVIFGTVVLVIGIAIFGLMSQKEALVLELEADTDAPRIEEEKALPLAELPNSIAVLPFADRSATQDQEYFADGLADTLLHVLSQVHGLKVAARTSSFAFKGQNESVKSIASQLGVANILEGSVQKSGNRIRVIAQLVEAEQGTQIWSHTFDGTLDDIFSIQDQIAEEVVDAMQLVLVDADSSRLADRYRPVTEAYDQLVLGRYAVAKGKVDDINAAVDHFEAAISIDPNYPLPYVYLADALAVQEIYALGLQDTFSGYTTPPTRERQQELIEKALDLDPRSGEAFATRATTQLDEKKAEGDFMKAIRLNENYAPAYLWYARFLSIRQGRYHEALTQLEAALKLDPLSNPIRHEHAKMVWATGRAEEAMSLLISYVKDNPDYPPYYKRMTRWQAQLGDMGRAALWVKELRRLEPNSPSHWGEWGGECWVLGRLGDPEATSQCQQEFVATFPESVAARRMVASMQAMKAGEMEVLYAKVLKNDLIDLFEELVRAEPGNDYRANQYASFLEQVGQYEQLLGVMEVAHPQLFGENPSVSGETTWASTMIINALQVTGRQEEANRLITAFESAIAGMRLIAGPGFTTGIEDVEIAALSGDTELAIQRFEKSVNSGWRFMWDFTPFMTSLKSIHDHPRFNELFLKMKADIDQQRAWYDENKDAPLY